MYLGTLVKSLLTLFLLVLSGYLIKKINLVSDKTVDELSDVLLKIILPASIIASGFEGKNSDIKSVGLSFLIISLCYIFFFLFSFIVFRGIIKDKGRRNLAINMCVFANTSFIGLPLVAVLFGSSGMIYAVIYNLLYNVFMYTLGIRLFGEKNEKLDIKAFVLNPLTLSSILSIVLFFLPLDGGGVVEDFLSTIGGLSGPLSMMLVGSWLIGVDLKSVLKKPLCYLVSLMRLLILPLSVFFVLSLLDVDELMTDTITLISAIPVGTLNVIFSKKFGGDFHLANETMMQSLVLSVVTIPLIVLLF